DGEHLVRPTDRAGEPHVVHCNGSGANVHGFPAPLAGTDGRDVESRRRVSGQRDQSKNTQSYSATDRAHSSSIRRLILAGSDKSSGNLGAGPGINRVAPSVMEPRTHAVLGRSSQFDGTGITTQRI